MGKKNRALSIVSPTVLFIDIIFLVALIPTINSFSQLYKVFNMQVSITTHIAMVCPYIFIIIVLVLIAKEFLENKTKTLIINVAVFLLLIFAISPFLVYGLFMPMRQLSEIVVESEETELPEETKEAIKRAIRSKLKERLE